MSNQKKHISKLIFALAILSFVMILLMTFNTFYNGGGDYYFLSDLQKVCVFQNCINEFNNWDGRYFILCEFVQGFSILHFPIGIKTLIWSLFILISGIIIFYILSLEFENDKFLENNKRLLILSLPIIFWFISFKHIAEIIYWTAGGASLDLLMVVFWVLCILEIQKSNCFFYIKIAIILFLIIVGATTQNFRITLISFTIITILMILNYFIFPLIYLGTNSMKSYKYIFNNLFSNAKLIEKLQYSKCLLIAISSKTLLLTIPHAVYQRIAIYFMFFKMIFVLDTLLKFFNSGLYFVLPIKKNLANSLLNLMLIITISIVVYLLLGAFKLKKEASSREIIPNNSRNKITYIKPISKKLNTFFIKFSDFVSYFNESKKWITESQESFFGTKIVFIKLTLKISIFENNRYFHSSPLV